MIEMLGQTDGNDVLGQVLPWVTSFVVAVLAAVFGAPVLKKKWQHEAIASATVTVASPVPTIHTKEEVELVTKPELRETIGRIDADLKDIKDALDKERSIARQANGNLHARMDKNSEALAEMKGTLSGVNDNVERLLDLATARAASLRKRGGA